MCVRFVRVSVRAWYLCDIAFDIHLLWIRQYHDNVIRIK